MEARVVVGIDFGTSRTGYALAYTADETQEVFFEYEWPGVPPKLKYPKTLSQLLYDCEGKLENWGWPASLQYAEECGDVKKTQFYFSASPEQLKERAKQERAKSFPTLCENFKMHIREGKPSPLGYLFVDNAGREFQVMRLVVDYLSELHKFIMSGPYLCDFAEEEIRWCLTVPAIWSDENKRFMREAAVKAGFIKNADDPRLILVLEPEAAALSSLGEFARTGNPFSDGSCFMLVDAGGGTVDITVHEVASDTLREVVPGSGDACGSTYVDQEFKKHIRQLLGNSCYERLCVDDPAVLFNMMIDWEGFKCSFSGQELRANDIEITRSLAKIIEAYNPELFPTLQLQQGHDETIELAPSTIRSFFQPVVNKVIAAVRKQFLILEENKKSCDYIVLVGGFANSKFLEQILAEEFHPIPIRIPPAPERAVVHGAVLYGLDERRISSRRTRLSYGCDTRNAFQELIDPESKKVWNPDRNRYECKNCFSQFVTAGQSVDFDACVRQTFVPTKKYQSSMNFDFFATPEKQSRYIDEHGMKKIGTLNIDLPSPSDNLKRTVEVKMFFGKTEILVEAKDLESGRQVTCTLQFERG